MIANCHDCFAALQDDDPRFAVLKQMRDWPPDMDPIDARALNSMLFDAVYVCADCSGWYGDEAIAVNAYESGHA